MVIDMHNHTNVSSPCSVLYPEELIAMARLLGLDGICVTEHNVIEGAEITREIGRKMNFPVFRGIEVGSELGDMLVFGYYKNITPGISLEKLCELVHNAGGVVFAAHPFYRHGGWNLFSALWKKRINLETDWEMVAELKQLDGVEIRNGSIGHEINMKAEKLAMDLNLKGIGGSDSHRAEEIATAATRFRNPIHSDSELVEALKKGEYSAFYYR